MCLDHSACCIKMLSVLSSCLSSKMQCPLFVGCRSTLSGQTPFPLAISCLKQRQSYLLLPDFGFFVFEVGVELWIPPSLPSSLPPFLPQPLSFSLSLPSSFTSSLLTPFFLSACWTSVILVVLYVLVCMWHATPSLILVLLYQCMFLCACVM